MIKLLLEHDAPIGNAFFHAAQVSSTAVVKTLCDHLKGKKVSEWMLVKKLIGRVEWNEAQNAIRFPNPSDRTNEI